MGGIRVGGLGYIYTHICTPPIPSSPHLHAPHPTPVVGRVEPFAAGRACRTCRMGGGGGGGVEICVRCRVVRRFETDIRRRR
jgi:hypothetical protein